MALSLRPYIEFDINTGETLQVLDFTGPYDATENPGGYGSPNLDARLVNRTRFIFSSYIQEQNAGEVIAIVAGTEYLVGGTGNFTYDTKTYSAGDTFISMLSGTPTLSNCTLTQTGRFSCTTTFLPVDDGSSDITPSLSIGLDNLIYPDSSYSLWYGIYTTSYTAQAGIPAGTYIVYGTVGQTVTISGVTYRVNEVFTQGGSFTMTGTGSIALFYDSAEIDFQLSYYANQTEIDLEQRLANSACGCKDKLTESLVRVDTYYTAIQNYFNSDLGTDFSGTQTLFGEIALIGANPCC